MFSLVLGCSLHIALIWCARRSWLARYSAEVQAEKDLVLTTNKSPDWLVKQCRHVYVSGVLAERCLISQQNAFRVGSVLS
jgi:hypothetical protein